MEGSSFSERVSERAVELDDEARQQAAEEVDRERHIEEYQRRVSEGHDARLARLREHRGYSPEEIWGEGSPEAQACREFLDYMGKHDFPGIKTFAHTPDAPPPPPKSKRRWLRREVVEPVQEAAPEEGWSTRGYGIGFVLEFQLTEEQCENTDGAYPYNDNWRPELQDVVLCEDGFVRRTQGGKIELLDAVNGNPDTPRAPTIGAVLSSYRTYWGSRNYSITNPDLETLLLQVAAHHTKGEPAEPSPVSLSKE